ncbi:terminase small subunit [Clostridium beijerinckii]|uniref:Phage terminase small subunit n=1 Tax=Clostridium beijerinckii TaxID=1520 RepID=A0AAE5H1X4_CLOBE|nr:terminase small subunit [Clostridium beijerinckii]ALB44601.1 terminase small subunit [Clostridium beijerinckii NRRL B-598]NSB13040.1 phage terminase small subunit [Clostridium beijerinckii]OOM22142.1 terminase small subunit [Clostridium beijerinckii]
MAKLTLKQQIFCDEYLIDLNATQAAIRAGYSPSTAKDIGCENLAKPNIRTYIDKIMAERAKRTGINQDRVIRELARIAFINPNDVMNLDEVTVKENASEDDLAAIQSVRIKTVPTKNGKGVEREIKLADKLKALELLGKHLGMFTDKVDLNVSATEKFANIIEQLGGKGLEE